MDFLGPRACNLYASACIFAFGLIFLATQSAPGKALSPPRIRAAFICWWSSSGLLSLVYLNFLLGQPAPEVLSVIVVDTSSILGFAFFAYYVFGDSLDEKVKSPGPGLLGRVTTGAHRLWNYLFGLWLVCTAIVLVCWMLDFRKAALGSMLQISLSELVGTVAVLLGGWAFVLRYGHALPALLVGGVSVVYALFQLPSYVALFVDRSGEVAQGNGGELALYILAVLKVVRSVPAFLLFAAPFWWEVENGVYLRRDPTKIRVARLWPRDGLLRPVVGSGRKHRQGKRELVFISHASADSDTAIKLAAAFEAADYEAWYFERDSKAALDHLAQTGDAIGRAFGFVLIISQASLKKSTTTANVAKEVEKAHYLKKSFLPVLVDVSLEEFARRQPAWHMAVGAYPCFSIAELKIEEVQARLVQGLNERRQAPAPAKDSGCPEP